VDWHNGIRHLPPVKKELNAALASFEGGIMRVLVSVMGWFEGGIMGELVAALGMLAPATASVDAPGTWATMGKKKLHTGGVAS